MNQSVYHKAGAPVFLRLLRSTRNFLHVLLLLAGASVPGYAQDANLTAVRHKNAVKHIHVMQPSSVPRDSRILHAPFASRAMRHNLTPVNTGSGIVYTCDPSIEAATCTYLNTTVAGWYNGTFTNANANIYITYGATGLGSSVNLNIGDAYVDITNSGASAGNICANVYTFDPSEELISCCTCSVTPNGLQALSVLTSLTSNPLTPAVPTAVAIKLVATSGTCNAAAVTPDDLAPGMLAWGTSLHAGATSPASYAVTETPFSVATLTAAELAHITSTCGFIQANGSGFGICKGCAAGGLGAATQKQ